MCTFGAKKQTKLWCSCDVIQIYVNSIPWATLIIGKKGRKEIGKCSPTKFSSLRLVSMPVFPNLFRLAAPYRKE